MVLVLFESQKEKGEPGMLTVFFLSKRGGGASKKSRVQSDIREVPSPLTYSHVYYGALYQMNIKPVEHKVEGTNKVIST